jgi:hypothetical protein
MATIKQALGKAGGNIFNRTLGRLFGSGISRNDHIRSATAAWSGRKDERDWRVRLTIPQDGPLQNFFFEQENLGNNRLAPLHDIGGIFWPLTPSMMIQHTANYNALSQTHSNYPFQAYQNSQVDQMNIIGEFPVQNQQDALYWVAAVNFLRTVTKMFFGKDEDNLKGNPPPILHLNGYGDHMFQNVPVIVNTFNVELRSGIDYISTSQDQKFQRHSPLYKQEGNPNIHDDTTPVYDPNQLDQTWAPTISNISVLVTPIYSRESIKNFSLKDFGAGRLRGKDQIGFI